jgi:hypothetical protein
VSPAAFLLALVASWYSWHPGQAAAGPALRHGDWRGSIVVVCRAPFSLLTFRCVMVRLTDWCQCYRGTTHERAVDLDRSDFARLAPTSRGTLRVAIFTGL